MQKKRLALIGLLIILALGIPLTLYIFNQQQNTQSKASKSTVVSFSPTSTQAIPVQAEIGKTLPLDININPGSNAIASVKLEILFDQTKFETTGDTTFQTNSASFPQIVEAPIISPGKITLTVSIGTDPTKVIQQATRIGTLNLKPTTSTTTDENTTSITFGNNTQTLTLSTIDTPEENTLSSTIPAIIGINPEAIPTCSPRPACLDANPQCYIPEPTGGWCAPATPTLTPLPTPISQCKDAPTDTILLIDTSGSMNDRITSSDLNKMESAKDAAKKFVDMLAANNQNKVSLVSFGSVATINTGGLTNDYTTIKSLIQSLNTSGYTCHECAIVKTNEEFTAHGRSNAKKVAILLTDGGASWIIGGTQKDPNAKRKALEAVKNAYNQNKVSFYTIGLGQDVKADFLKEIADSTGGKYYFSPTAQDLQKIYQEISTVIAKGSINGFVYNDTNNNKTYDVNENKLPGWTLNLSSQDTTTKTLYSDQTGAYSFNNLCDGTYKINQTTKPGWTQTTPNNPNEHTITITNGNAVTDKNFGNYQAPSPTSAPNTTTLILNSLLDGIGSRGDNTNPDGSSSNKNPLNPERNITINIFDSSNQLVAYSTSKMKYSSASGDFAATFNINQSLTSGSYTIRARTDNHLTRLLPGIQTITAGQSNKLPNATFIAGDATNDNKLDILDYNALIGCYSDLAVATSCNTTQKSNTDLNDDGKVNQFDYNLFLRELAIQPGQ